MLDQVLDVVRSFDGISPELARSLSADTNVVRDLNLDSVAVMDFVMALETRFDTIIPIDLIARAETIGDLAHLLAAPSRQARH